MQIPRSPHDVTIGVGHLLTLARRSVFEAFADFLCGVYKKRTREGVEEELAGSSVIYYLRCSLREAQKRFEALRSKMSGMHVSTLHDFLGPHSEFSNGGGPLAQAPHRKHRVLEL